MTEEDVYIVPVAGGIRVYIKTECVELKYTGDELVCLAREILNKSLDTKSEWLSSSVRGSQHD